jgi:hypothetical protein
MRGFMRLCIVAERGDERTSETIRRYDESLPPAACLCGFVINALRLSDDVDRTSGG